MDEPTSVLTPQEADEVLGQVQALARSGVLSVLLITHKFREVFAYCDEVTVLRRGRHAGHSRVADTTRDALAGWMMGAAEGRAADQAAISGAGAAQPGGEPVGGGAAADVLPPTGAARLAVRDLVVLGANGRHAVGRLSLEVAPGEIVGIAGISGNGQRELVAALTGVLPIASGRIEVDGKPYRATRRQMREFRLRSLPEEPLVNACVGRLSVAENIALRNFDVAPLSRAGWLSHRAVQRQAHERIERFRVRPPRPDAPIETLSGGNVQRAVLSRELSDPPRLLIVANPCFGLDFQATNEIHARLRAARDGGAGILLVSEDLDELLALSTRLLVLSHGNVAYACNAGGQPVDITAVGRAMAGDTHAADARQAA
jgi:simple sugar transport system ATP-binding protein